MSEVPRYYAVNKNDGMAPKTNIDDRPGVGSLNGCLMREVPLQVDARERQKREARKVELDSAKDQVRPLPHQICARQKVDLLFRSFCGQGLAKAELDSAKDQVRHSHQR